MALNTSGLGTDLADWMDSPGATIVANAATWADAVESYTSGIVPASATVSAAAATLETAMVSAMGLADAASTATALEAAFLAFATTVGGGMAGFTPVPPPAPLGFAALLAARPATSAAAASSWASAIDTWMRTGTAALIAPPGPPALWS